jgi:hypothetical protein
MVFGLVTGLPLPAPVASDKTAMMVWSGLAFVRIVGALLTGIGAVLWTVNAARPRAETLQTVLCGTAIFAALITSAQQVAIWSNSIGWLLVALFGAIAAVSGLRLRRTAPTLATR